MEGRFLSSLKRGLSGFCKSFWGCSDDWHAVGEVDTSRFRMIDRRAGYVGVVIIDGQPWRG